MAGFGKAKAGPNPIGSKLDVNSIKKIDSVTAQKSQGGRLLGGKRSSK